MSLSFALLLGVKMHHLFLKSSENPVSGPLSSVPAMGCDEIQDTLFGMFFSIKEIAFFFTDPTSVNIAPLFNEFLFLKLHLYNYLTE